MSEDILPVTTEVLVWARERAGYSIDEAVAKAKIRAGRDGKSPEERLLSWESGESAPTATQLKDLARIYFLPVITFFLPSPPIEVSGLKDFRTIGNHRFTVSSPKFLALKLRIESLHDTLKEISEADPEPLVPFVGSLTMETPIEKAVETINSLIPWSVPVPANLRTPRDAFNELREKIQVLGVYVTLRGDLGSYHTQIQPSEFRGIAIADKIAPLIVINPYDSDAAHVFTLIHEFVHILLGNSAISNLDDQISQKYVKEELFCNSVTAEFLVPEKYLLQIIPEDIGSMDLQEFANEVAVIAKDFHVSRLVIARKLKDLKYINDSTYWTFYDSLAQAGKKSWERGSRKGGPSANVVAKYRLGEKLASRIIEAADSGIISYSSASYALNIKAGRFDKVMA
ncbi:MAG: hypothetical protein BWY01_00614 [Synergistetes bacterium ADurb.Bin155]|jgi:Zn-dependent peptidase ImmA (M78 family)|nr:MAG: hypothetical protein BWY01_00614 [Synergistetes bacterium ADurb.Bin155]